MDFKKFEKVCNAHGIKEFDVYHVSTNGSAVSTFCGQTDKNVTYETNEIYIRAVVNGQVANIYVEKDDESEYENIVKHLIASAKVLESEEPYFFFEGSKKYPELKKVSHDYAEYSQGDRLDLCKKMEAYVREKCPYVALTQAQVDVATTRLSIENTSGLHVEKENNEAAVVCVAVVQKDGDTRQGFYFDFVENLKDIDYDKLYRVAVERPLSMIGAKACESKQYPVVFENQAFASLLGCFGDMFSGEAVVKKLCLLDGKLGHKVFGDNVTLTDDPFLEKSPFSTTFDDEGVATSKKNIVENGVLKTYLHSLKTAAMLGAEPTGNGFKGQSGAISTRATNLCLKSGEKNLDEILAMIDDGIFITGMMGQHAGVNEESGAFNLQSSGYRIRNGKLAEPVTLIVVSGNIVDLLNNVVEIGNDFEISRLVACGSVYVKSLAVSGN
ncbi:MAG: TldD/PmbA family protein [Clostridia bacterium]|nr:TldD/PmbA family protein [Clostridia bacterium]